MFLNVCLEALSLFSETVLVWAIPIAERVRHTETTAQW